jgi:hypothetical protein
VSKEPRQYTKEEARDLFLKQVRAYIDYWENESRQPTIRQKLEGLAFSIMVLIDGEAATVPGWILAPSPHPDDREYNISKGENYFADNTDAQVLCDIGGGLHDRLLRLLEKAHVA